MKASCRYFRHFLHLLSGLTEEIHNSHQSGHSVSQPMAVTLTLLTDDYCGFPQSFQIKGGENA